MAERAPERPEPHRRADYGHFAPILTRWMDNDVYGHVNNVQYYSFFDTVVNGYLIAKGVLKSADEFCDRLGRRDALQFLCEPEFSASGRCRSAGGTAGAEFGAI